MAPQRLRSDNKYRKLKGFEMVASTLKGLAYKHSAIAPYLQESSLFFGYFFKHLYLVYEWDAPVSPPLSKLSNRGRFFAILLMLTVGCIVNIKRIVNQNLRRDSVCRGTTAYLPLHIASDLTICVSPINLFSRLTHLRYL